MTPVEERCDDGQDTNCNGQDDRSDPACASDAEPGDPCREDADCGDELGCLDPTNFPRFRGGYCGQQGCPPDGCPEGTACATLDNRRYCLRPCEGSGECRGQYTCADGGEGETVCLPKCVRNEECPAETPICDLQTGLCGADDEDPDPPEDPDSSVISDPDAAVVDAAPLGPPDPMEADGAKPYYESIDMDDAYHAQTILAYELNDQPLPIANGAPVRLRVERQLGYKQAKYIMRIELVESFAAIAGGKGGYWEDQGYEWYAGI